MRILGSRSVQMGKLNNCAARLRDFVEACAIAGTKENATLTPYKFLNAGQGGDGLRCAARGADLLQLAIRVKCNPPAVGRPAVGLRTHPFRTGKRVGECSVDGSKKKNRVPARSITYQGEIPAIG